VIAPGATIGILGGGQLGRMLAIAAAQMGYRVHIYAPDEELPAADVAAEATRAAYGDIAALDRFAAAVDVVTYEFENVDVAAVRHLMTRVPVRPGARVLEIAQDRLAEKDFVRGLGGRPAPYRAIDSLDALTHALASLGTPAILKTLRMGYDGKGQVRIDTPAGAAAAWDAVGRQMCVLEALVRFDAEFSVILARGADGMVSFYDIPENRHEGGILARSTVPASSRVAPHEAQARALAEKVAAALDHVGVLTLEFFATADGPVFNEMAPRVHNSGHWTIEGARVSQFENHIRAVCGLPLGDTALTAPDVAMENLLGESVNDWQAILADPAAHLHLYGKSEVKPGRKMGHVTWLSADGAHSPERRQRRRWRG
jgi:5-(carboxyamino)imidazole ribonucleotide synthase